MAKTMAPRILGTLPLTAETPDGPRIIDNDRARAIATTMLDAGADLVGVALADDDAPPPVGAPDRVAALVAALRADGVAVAIDTAASEVAAAALDAGAELLIDRGALHADLAANAGVGWVAVHQPRSGGPDPSVAADRPAIDPADVVDELVRMAEAGRDAGVSTIWVDPGLERLASADDYRAMTAGLDRLAATGWPVSVGTGPGPGLGRWLARSDASTAAPALPPSSSGPGLVGSVPAPTTGSESPVALDDQATGAVAMAAHAMACGAALVRVHDVDGARQAATVLTGTT